ncbi:MAG TPA: TIR domain-containing protein, partial [Pyrinomonadaceae bacterium]|nr:TIR domain-containing protein [Pyrinomonadaceae bacterium]
MEITKAVSNTHVVIVCLSPASINNQGYVHKEIKFALDVADRQPEGAIFLIPLKLEECDVPNRLRDWHWVDLYEETGYEKLTKSLLRRAEALGIATRPLRSAVGSGPSWAEPSGGDATEKELAGLVGEARELMRAESWGEAIEKLQTALFIRRDHEEASALLKHAQRHRELAEVEKLYEAGYEHLNAGQLEEALSRFQEVQKREESYRGTEALIARCQEKIKEKKVAALLAEAEKSVGADDWKTAIDRLRAVLSEDPGHKVATDKLDYAVQQQKLSELYSEGQNLYLFGRRREALARFRQIQDLAGGYKDVPGRIAKIEREEAEAEAARQAEERANREEFERLFREAQEELAKEDWEPAIEKLQDLAVRDASNEEVRRRLAQAQMGLMRASRLKKLVELYAEGERLYRAGDRRAAWLCLTQFREAAGDQQGVAALIAKIESEEAGLYRARWYAGWGVASASLVAGLLLTVGFGLYSGDHGWRVAYLVPELLGLSAGLCYVYRLGRDADSWRHEMSRLRSVREAASAREKGEQRFFLPTAEERLSRRLESLDAPPGEAAIDRSYLTCSEYQLFIDDRQKQGEYNQPDHWVELKYPAGAALQPVSGVRAADAAELCKWLTLRSGGGASYRLPRPHEAITQPSEEAALAAWCADGKGYRLVGLSAFSKQAIRRRLSKLSTAGLPMPASLARRLEIKRSLERSISMMPHALALALGARLHVTKQLIDVFTDAVALDLTQAAAKATAADLAFVIDFQLAPDLATTGADSIAPFGAAVAEGNLSKIKELAETFGARSKASVVKLIKLL